jgi:hypothetical protein
MPGAGAATVAFVKENGFQSEPSTPDYYLPGRDITTDTIEAQNALSRLTLPDQAESVEHSFPQRPRVKLRNGQGVLEDDDTYTTSGDGSQTTFNIPHKLDHPPAQWSVEPMTADAAADHYVEEVTQNVIKVTFLSAPPSGTDNLKWHYRAVSD